jgi:hypothetical protein
VEHTDDTREAPADGAPVRLRLSAFDRFLQVQNSDVHPPPPGYTFYQDITKDGGYPVFSNGKTHPVWPPTEEWAYSMLLLHKPGVHCFADVKGASQTYLDEFLQFLALGRPHVPDCLARDISRAYTSYLFRKPDQGTPRFISS